MKKLILIIIIVLAVLLTLLLIRLIINNLSSERQDEVDLVGNLMINSPGLNPEVWYLNHETPGSPGTVKMLQTNAETVCSGLNQCSKFFVQDESLAGSWVEIRGTQVDSTINLAWIEFLEDQE